MRDRLAFALSAAVFLFLAEALRALFGVVFAFLYDALFPDFHLLRLVVALLPLAGLAVPIIPFLRWLERDRLVGYAVLAAALLRIGLCLPFLHTRAVFAALVLACCAVFIVTASGSFSRRAHAAGAAAGLVLDLVLRLAGRSYDLTLRPQWLPAQIALAALAALAVFQFLRTPEPENGEEDEERLERRAGGLRLRGALILGSILFLQSSVVNMPEVVARLARVPYDAVGLLLVVAGTAAVAALLTTAGPIGRQRAVAVPLAGLAALAALGLFLFSGWRIAIPVAIGSFALLVLLYRALAPAGGRRGGWVIAVGLGWLVALQLLYNMTFFYAFTLPALEGRAPLFVGLAGVFLCAVLLITPTPVPSVRRRLRIMPVVAVCLTLIVLGLRLTWRNQPRPLTTSASTLRVLTWNVHYGYNLAWRYDPESIAQLLESSAADVIVLQEVPAGVPAAYGTDLALWLGRRLRMQSRFAPSINRLLGDAVLTRLPIASFDSALLPPEPSDQKQLSRLVVGPGDPVTVFATHLGVLPAEREEQARAIVSLIGTASPAVLAGDLNAEPGSPPLEAFQRAGFRSVFDLLGRPPLPTWPAHAPRQTIDHILVRGLQVDDVRVLESTASDHRAVLATLRRP